VYCIVLFCSVSAVKCKFGCMELKSVKMACMFVWLESKTKRYHRHKGNS